TFTASLSATSPQTITVAYATADDTATAGSDYTAKSGTLVFPPSTLNKTITIAVTGDTLDEVNERFKLNLTSPVNATIADATGLVTIVDNDGPTISIDNVTITEGNSGSLNASFTVSLSATSPQTITVAYATADDTATAGSDYT